MATFHSVQVARLIKGIWFTHIEKLLLKESWLSQLHEAAERAKNAVAMTWALFSRMDPAYSSQLQRSMDNFKAADNRQNKPFFFYPFSTTLVLNLQSVAELVPWAARAFKGKEGCWLLRACFHERVFQTHSRMYSYLHVFGSHCLSVRNFLKL